MHAEQTTFGWEKIQVLSWVFSTTNALAHFYLMIVKHCFWNITYIIGLSKASDINNIWCEPVAWSPIICKPFMAIMKFDTWLKSTLIINHEACEILLSNGVNSNVGIHCGAERWKREEKKWLIFGSHVLISLCLLLIIFKGPTDSTSILFSAFKDSTFEGR